MALHGPIAVNEQPIGYWSARRVEELTGFDDVHTYECTVRHHHRASPSEIFQTFTLAHRYSDGAIALAAKVLARAAADY